MVFGAEENLIIVDVMFAASLQTLFPENLFSSSA